jgi:hypothetical protein
MTNHVSDTWVTPSSVADFCDFSQYLFSASFICAPITFDAVYFRHHLFPAMVFIQPWHDLDKIAGPVTVVELFDQNLVPRILAGPR